MMMVVSVVVVDRVGGRGELLSMSDGSVWFHPFNGSKPIQEKEAVA